MKVQHAVAFIALAASTQAYDLLGAVAELPQCGIECLTSSISASSCSSLIDAACICTDQAFYEAGQNCILKTCSPLDAMKVARVEATACERPIRSRKRDLALTLAIEVPAWLCPWLRLYWRWNNAHHLTLDDYVMMACSIFFTVFVVLGQYISHIAFGEDLWQVDPSNVTTALKMFYIDETFYLLSLCLTKLCVLAFYLQIFPNRSFKIAAVSTASFVTFSTVVFIFLAIFPCTPISFNWEGWINPNMEHQCININAIAFAAAGSSILQEIIILVLPLPLLLRLQTGTRTKIGILVMFSLGTFVLATSIVRLQYLVHFGHSNNPTWDYTGPLIWTGLEVSVSIIVACLPAIRALLQQSLPQSISKVFTRGSRNGAYDKNGSAGTSGASQTSRSGKIQQEYGDEKPRQTRRFSVPGSHFLTYSASTTPWAGILDDESQWDLSLRLGDKAQGDVQTAIGANHEDLDLDNIRGDIGIHVTTTTTTQVNTEEWSQPFGSPKRSASMGRGHHGVTSSQYV